MSDLRRRGIYKPRFDWTAERIAVLQAALPQAATTTPYSLACTILHEQEWPTTAKTIANKLYSLLRKEQEA